MKERRVVITGAGGISPLGTDWESVKAKILSQTNAVKVIDNWADITGLKTRVACPAVPFALDPVKYGRKATRSMGRVGIMAVRSAEVALTDAGLFVVRRSRHRLWVKRGDALGNRGRRKPDSQTHHARDERQHLRANDVAYGTSEYRDLL